MWDKLLPKMVGGTITDDDAPNEPTEIIGFELSESRVVIKGKEFDFGGARQYIGVQAGPVEGTFRVRGYGGLSAVVKMPVAAVGGVR